MVAHSSVCPDQGSSPGALARAPLEQRERHEQAAEDHHGEADAGDEVEHLDRVDVTGRDPGDDAGLDTEPAGGDAELAERPGDGEGHRRHQRAEEHDRAVRAG